MRKYLAAMLLAGSAIIPATAQSNNGLKHVKDIPLPGVTGRFDHFAFAAQKNILFVAATGNHSVEVVDTASGTVKQSIRGLGKPHGLAWVPEMDRLFVADGTLAALNVYEGSSLKLVRSIPLSDDADDMVYDPKTRLLFVGHGGSDGKAPGQVAIIDPVKLQLLSNLPADSHPEALELDPVTDRVFVNIADSAEVLVIDAKRQKAVATWKLTRAQDNVPVAYDHSTGILLLGCRKPAKLLALDGHTGRELQDLDSSSGADDLFYDAGSHKAYLITGSGHVDVYRLDANKSLEKDQDIETANGAKTGLLVPSTHTLYVGIPSAGSESANIRVFATSVSQ